MPPPFPARVGRYALLAGVVAVAAAGSGCGSGASGDSAAELTVVATTTHVADLVRNVGGRRVEVRQLLSPGADPHHYEPRPSDAQAVVEAAVVFESGGDLDQWLEGLLENAGGDAEAVTLIDSVRTEDARTIGDPGEEGEVEDPHWWQDPRNAVLAVGAIADALAEADPEGAETYRAHAESYGERLERLDREIARCIERVPEAQRKLVTTHDAYGYYADRYGIELIGALIPTRGTEAQPSAGEIAELVELVEQEGVEAIFPESPVDPGLEQAVAEEAGVRTGEPLWADSLGPEDSDGGTYIEAMASDTAAMVAGFTGGAKSCRPRA